MKIAVFSDSHGDVEAMESAIRAERPDMVLHLGDHARDAEALAALFPGLDVRYVCGNCDYGSDAPDSLCFSVEDVRLYMAHGHRHSVKYDLLGIANAGHFSGADLVLYGHTHQSEYRDLGDLTLFNPGSCGMGRRTYGILTAKGGKFQCQIRDI